jgi:iron only hydrogenase large subunit-like protein
VGRHVNFSIKYRPIEKEGKCEYQFIEVMACPGGCAGGGGQSWGSNMAKRARRGESLYAEDKSCLTGGLMKIYLSCAVCDISGKPTQRNP